MTMHKKLVFNFYITSDWQNNKVNQIHLKCLKKYSHIFDELLFVIMVDNTGDIQLIREAERCLMDLHSKGRIIFKIAQNTKFRESLTFKEEIVDKLGTDEAVFFGHNKGITNIKTFDKKIIYIWILWMYFYSLNYADEVESTFIDSKTLSYGSCCTVDMLPNRFIKNNWFYAGTFFWIHSKKLKWYIDSNNIKIPTMDDRVYDEEFLGNIINYSYPVTQSYQGKYLVIDVDDYYHYAEHYLNIVYPEHEDFKNFYNEIIEE